LRKAALLAACLLASCTTERDWRKVASTARVGYYQGHDEMDFVHGSKDANGDNYGFTLSIQPLAFLEPPTIVQIQQPQPQPETKPK
jgi:hypothetical protein